ncbi:MAG: SDR family oxidoreductase [Magnetococcus sp. YQC-9]
MFCTPLLVPDGRWAMWRGFKWAVAVVLSAPFWVVLLPMWGLYRWNERRLGREPPPLPWAEQRGMASGKQDVVPRSAATGFEFSESPDAPAKHIPPPPESRSDFERTVDEPGKRAARGVALVTGGNRRLGAAICRDLARLGYAVAVGYHRDQQAAEAVVAEIQAKGGIGGGYRLDLTTPDGVEALLTAVERDFGRKLAVLVNSAGMFEATPPDGGSWQAMSVLLQVNLQGPLWWSLQAAQRMKAHGNGVIVQIADLWGERPLAGHAVYGAAKAGLLMATRVLARDLAPQVRVNAIAPGAILPPEDGMDPGYQRMLERTPLAGQAGPEAVVMAVRYLLGADYVTGEVLHVDGGRGLG